MSSACSDGQPPLPYGVYIKTSSTGASSAGSGATGTETTGAIGIAGTTTQAAKTTGATTFGAVGTGAATSTAATTSAGTTGAATSGAGTTGGAVDCSTTEEELFSFFVTSHAALQRESGSPDGFGGDFGGIAGADQLCQSIAETSSACAADKTWRAFLSTTDEDAIDRIGEGPWHDRLGRLLANDLSELTTDGDEDVRTLTAAHPTIRDDLPNEDGVPNRNPYGTGELNNHRFLTGTGMNGRLYQQDGGGGPNTCEDGDWTPEKATCWNWTTSDGVGCPRVGHSWPRDISGDNWLSVWNEGGCAPGGVIVEPDGPAGPDGTPRVGSGGGYGGIYCFAVTGL